jgi:hypothetical protein
MVSQVAGMNDHPAGGQASGEPIDEREYDLDWYAELSPVGQRTVDRWLGHLIYNEVAIIALTDHTNTTGNLTVVDIDDKGEVFLLQVYDVHWDDPFPVDAE